MIAIWTSPGLHSADASDTVQGSSDWESEGKALQEAGNYSGASQAFRRALTIAEHSEASQLSLARIHTALGSVYRQAGRYSEAEREYRRALASVEKTQGRLSLEYALIVAGVAVLPTQIRSRDSYIALLRGAIAVHARSGSAKDLAIIRSCLAQILLGQRRYAEAESVLLDAWPDFSKLQTTNPELVAALLNDLGMLRFSQGRYGESINFYKESHGLLAAAMGDDHPSIVAPLNDLALSYLQLGRLDDAEQTLQRASAICVKRLGEDHASCGALLENYAIVLQKLGRKREAKVVTARSQGIARASQRRDGVNLTISVTALGSDRH